MPFAGSLRPLQYSQLAYTTRRFATAVSVACKDHLSCFTRRRNSGSERLFSQQRAKSVLQDLKERSAAQSTLVFQSTSDNPFHNLAIEHFLLTHSDVNSRILLFYTNRPSVVVGRNQNIWVECNLDLIHQGLNGRTIEVVRRRSGGGTVFHDEGNLNFSVIVPNDKDFTRKKHSEMVVRALNKMHAITAEYDGPEHIWVNNRHDITMAAMQNKGRSEFKVSGSAYKLTRGRALHHGTLLHSSPNLENISRFLRSPGKSYIEAKGVESVRSPVANLFNVQDRQGRDAIRTEITGSILREFLRLYETDAVPEVVGDVDCRDEINPAVAQGVHELLTNEWRLDQTPRFDFKSPIFDGSQLTFTVKNGLIEDVRLGRKEVPIVDRPRILMRQQQQQKIYHINDWSQVFAPGTIGNKAAAFIEQIFPNLRNVLRTDHLGLSDTDHTVQQNDGGLTRLHRDGRVERESRGLNTIEEVESRYAT